MTLVVRDSVSLDMEALRAVFRRSSLSNRGDRANLLANPEFLELPERGLHEGRTRVAIYYGLLVGFATSFVDGDHIEIGDLFVDPDYMGLGIGRALMSDLVARARQRGIQRIEVIANLHALGFYEKAGFIVDHYVDTHFSSAPRMCLDLS